MSSEIYSFSWKILQENYELFLFLQRNSSSRMCEGDDSEDLSLIPGFGFLPQSMVTKAERIFQANFFYIFESYIFESSLQPQFLTFANFESGFHLS